MTNTFFDPETQTYRDARAWPVSQAVSAAIAVARIPGAGTDAAPYAVLGFHQLDPWRTGSLYRASAEGDVFYDDNEWIAQDLLDWNALHHSPTAVARAEGIFGGITRAWDGDTSTPCAGGVYWTTEADVRDRNTVSTANGALVGLRLYALTHSRTYLAWSERMLAWVNRCMLAPNGLYWDHVSGDGTIDQREWSYNQGSLLGAYLLLYETTGERSSLVRAERIATAALAEFSGPLLSGEPPEFAAIFFDRLLELAAVDGRRSYVDAARTYGDVAWNELRDPETGLFSADLLGQAAFVQLYAHLALTDTGAAARRSQPRATAPRARGSGDAGVDLGRARRDPRTPPVRAGRTVRSSRTSR